MPCPFAFLGRDGKRAGFDARGVAGIADFVADEAGDSDGVADFAVGGFDEIGDGDRVFADEGLFEQADFFVELAHAAFGDFVEHLFGLAFGADAVALNFAVLSRQARRATVRG